MYGNTIQTRGRSVFHIGTLDKASGRLWNTVKNPTNWRDRAGAYGIQDPFGMKNIERINGDYYNVVGLPISLLCQMLKDEFDIEI